MTPYDPLVVLKEGCQEMMTLGSLSTQILDLVEYQLSLVDGLTRLFGAIDEVRQTLIEELIYLTNQLKQYLSSQRDQPKGITTQILEDFFWNNLTNWDHHE